MQSIHILTTEGMSPSVFSFRQVFAPVEESANGFLGGVEIEALMGSEVDLALPDFTADSEDAQTSWLNDFEVVSDSAFSGSEAPYAALGLASSSHSFVQFYHAYEAPFIP